MEKNVYLNSQLKIIIIAVGGTALVICLLFLGILYMRMSAQPEKVYHNLSKPIEPVESREFTYDEAAEFLEGNQQALDFMEQEMLKAREQETLNSFEQETQ